MSKIIKWDYDPDNVPVDVIDIEAYRAACELANSKELSSENIFIATSDPTLTIKLGSGEYMLKNRISHLPPKEYNKIIRLNKAVKSLYGRLSALKKKAVGFASARKSENENVPNQLYSEYRAELLDLFGRYYSAAEIQAIFINKYDLIIRTEWLHSFCMHNHEAVQELKEKYNREVGNVRLGHKRSRLEEALYIYNNRKWKYVQKDSIDNENQLLKILNYIRQETEDNTITINSNILAQVELSINNHERQELIDDAVLLRIIISRLASKYKVNPMFYINKLENSIYNRFNGVDPDIANYSSQPIWPSQQMFGLDTVEAKAREVDGVELRQRLEIPTQVIMSNNTNIKEALLAKIREKQEAARKNKTDIYLTSETDGLL